MVAEDGVNHNGDPVLVLELVARAAEAGADAVKFQTFMAEQLVTADAPKVRYQTATTDALSHTTIRRIWAAFGLQPHPYSSHPEDGAREMDDSAKAYGPTGVKDLVNMAHDGGDRLRPIDFPPSAWPAPLDCPPARREQEDR